MTDLRALLEDLLLYLDNRDTAAQFDEIAERFYAETGFMRPGKSIPMEMHGTSDERREEAWGQWCVAWRRALILRLDAALASQGAMSPQGDLQRAIQFGQMRGAWMFDQAWTAWEEQEARIARAQPAVKTVAAKLTAILTEGETKA